MKHYEFHPLANDFRLFTDDELNMMVEDMRANGFDPRYSIILYEGKILDGRNRYAAAQVAGVEPVFVNLPVGQDPEEFVYRVNDLRRHDPQEEQRRKRRERVARVAERRKQGQSIRQIAQQEAVSVVQVQRDLVKPSGVPGGGAPEPAAGKVIGRDGKTYTTSRSKAPARKPKPGSPVFDDRVVTDLIGKLARAIDKRRQVLGKTPGHDATRAACEELIKAWKSWQKEKAA